MLLVPPCLFSSAMVTSLRRFGLWTDIIPRRPWAVHGYVNIYARISNIAPRYNTSLFKPGGNGFRAKHVWCPQWSPQWSIFRPFRAQWIRRSGIPGLAPWAVMFCPFRAQWIRTAWDPRAGALGCHCALSGLNAMPACYCPIIWLSSTAMCQECAKPQALWRNNLKAGDGTRTHNSQLGRLHVNHW